MGTKTQITAPGADDRGMTGPTSTRAANTSAAVPREAVTRVIAYIRESGQGADGAALERQETVVRAHARERGWVLTAVHRDRADGKGLFNRPGLAAAVRELEAPPAPEMPILIVSDLDRLTESPAGLARLLTRAADHGWGLVALDVEMDTTTRAGRRTADTLRRVGAWTHRRISEGTKSGMARAAAQGRRPGRPRTTSAAVVHRLCELRASGLSFRDIAGVLNDEGSRGSHGGRWSERTARAAYARYRAAAA